MANFQLTTNDDVISPTATQSINQSTGEDDFVRTPTTNTNAAETNVVTSPLLSETDNIDLGGGDEDNVAALFQFNETRATGGYGVSYQISPIFSNVEIFKLILSDNVHSADAANSEIAASTYIFDASETAGFEKVVLADFDSGQAGGDQDKLQIISVSPPFEVEIENGNGAGNLEIVYDNVSGDSDTINLNLSTAGIDTVTIRNVETITLTTLGLLDNTVKTLDTDATAYSITSDNNSGGGKITVINSFPAVTRSFDGTNSSNALDLTFTNGTVNRTLIGGSGTDTLTAGAGDDSITAGSGTDSITGGDGNDTLMGGVGADTLIGSDGNDTIDGEGDADSILGGAGQDTLTGSSGNDTLDGGEGADYASYNGPSSGYTVETSNGVTTVTATTGGDGTDTLTNIENLIFSDRTVAITTTTTPTLSIADASITEADSFARTLTFTVTLSEASTSEVTVAYATSNGTATAGAGANGTASGSSDYTATSGTLTFAAGETSKTVSVSVTGDIAIESDEAFTVTLSGASGATIADATATGTITENEVSVWSGQAYVDANPDLAAAGVTAATALEHYTAFGYAENRLISFDAAAYLEVNPDVAAAGITTANAITHYINFGKNENRPFTADAYLNANPDLVAAGLDAAGAGAHYANFGKNESRSPGFDAAGYALLNQDLVTAGFTVSQFIEHWTNFGQTEGRKVFDPGQYFAANTDVATAGASAY
ncbi:MAG: hypothetical protein NXI16_12610, partial [Alphaproteobacteria bacterium]|nr:hypothetical protein [Alphaproteobacteria bacterium]